MRQVPVNRKAVGKRLRNYKVVPELVRLEKAAYGVTRTQAEIDRANIELGRVSA